MEALPDLQRRGCAHQRTHSTILLVGEYSACRGWFRLDAELAHREPTGSAVSAREARRTTAVARGLMYRARMHEYVQITRMPVRDGAPGVPGKTYAFRPSRSSGTSLHSTVSPRPLHPPMRSSSALSGSFAARSKIPDRSGGGKRALYFFSAARNGVQSVSRCSGRFRVDLRYFRLAFLYSALVGSCRDVVEAAMVPRVRGSEQRSDRFTRHTRHLPFWATFVWQGLGNQTTLIGVQALIGDTFNTPTLKQPNSTDPICVIWTLQWCLRLIYI